MNAKGTSHDKLYTEYKRDTSRDYEAITSTPNGTRYGKRVNHNKWSKNYEHTITSGGTVRYKVEIWN
ncbi:MAG: hypothetical protein ACK5HR_04840 [Mycoplasmatales bacterium]